MHAVVDFNSGPTGALGTRMSVIQTEAHWLGWLTANSWETERRTLERGLLNRPQQARAVGPVAFTLTQAAVLQRLYAEGKSDDINLVTRRLATQGDLLVRLNLSIEALEPLAD